MGKAPDPQHIAQGPHSTEVWWEQGLQSPKGKGRERLLYRHTAGWCFGHRPWPDSERLPPKKQITGIGSFYGDTDFLL
jgi:hypothetical protein